jgi:subtilisin family serine protease
MKWFLPLLLLFASTAEATIKVAVIDTGLDLSDPRFKSVLCKTGHKDFTGTGLDDTHGHGTHVTGLIKQYAGVADYCLVIIKFYNEFAPSKENAKNALKSMHWAVQQKVTIVNLSADGPEYEDEEFSLIKHTPFITYIVAAGNQGKEMPEHCRYPACYDLPNVIAVGALNAKGVRAEVSNYGYVVKVWELGEYVRSTLPNGGNGYLTGTSQATAIHTGKVIKQRHEKASSGRVSSRY